MKRNAVLLLLVLFAACGKNTDPPSLQPDATVRVLNMSFLEMNVYVVRGFESTRLGSAAATSTTRLRIPGRLLTGPIPLRFQARPIGSSRQPVTEEIAVTPGDEVEMIIPADDQ